MAGVETIGLYGGGSTHTHPACLPFLQAGSIHLPLIMCSLHGHFLVKDMGSSLSFLVYASLLKKGLTFQEETELEIGI